MALSGRIRSGISLFNKFGYLTPDSLSAQRSTLTRTLIAPANSVASRKFSATSGQQNEKNVKVPKALFGGSGNYASALYLAAVKSNVLDKVESEFLNLVEAAKNSPTFSQFAKDLSVPSETRVKAVQDVASQAKFSEITTNFLVLLAENGRLSNMDTIAEKFVELTMAYKGETKAIVTTVIPLPPAEEKELREALQEILGAGKNVKLEHKIDRSILGGLVIEFDQKVFDMSIKTRALQMERFLRDPVNISNI